MSVKGPKANASKEVEKQVVEPTAKETPTSPEPALAQAYKQAQEAAAAQFSSTQPTRNEQFVKGTNTMSTQQNQTFANAGAGFMEAYRPRYSISEAGDADAAVLLETIRAIQKNNEAANSSSINFHTLSKAVTGNFTAVGVSIPQVIDGKLVVGVHAFIMEASRPPLESLTQPGPNGAIEVVISPVDAYTQDFVNLLHKEVSRHYNNEAQLIDAGLQVIYRETVLTDQVAVATILNESVQAIDSILRSLDAREASRRFGLDRVVKSQDVRVLSKFAMDEKRVQANGLPLRADISAELIMQQSSGKQQPIPTNTSMKLSACTGYVDLVYVAPTQMFNGAFANQQQQHYVPRLTMTSLSTEMAGSSLEFILLAIANMTTLNRNRAWGVQFRDSYNKMSEGSLRNLGAIGWQMPHLGADGQPGNLVIESEQQLQQLIHTAIDPRLVYSLEVEQAGQNSWLLEVFSRAAGGDISANADILDACDNLTGGRLRPIFAQLMGVSLEAINTTAVIRATQDLNHIGYYKDPKTGLPADIRELDLVAVLNIANGNIELVRDYLSTTVTTAGEHPLQRLDKRLRIFRNICSEVVIKGYTTKYDFNAKFIQALIAAIESTGFVLNASNTLLTSQEQVYTQTVQDWASVMVDPSVGGNLYQTHSFQPQGNVYNVGQNFGYSHWGR